MKKIYVDQLKEGDRFDELFLVKSAKLGETRAGKPYLVLTLMDRSGEVSGPVWDNALEVQPICETGAIVKCSGSVQLYREKPQLKFDGIVRVASDGVDLSCFFPATSRCREEMAAQLHKIIKRVNDPYLKKLLNYFFKENEWWTSFQQAPAAKGIHHAYIGGLLEHSLSVAQLAELFAGHYEGLNRALLVTGALLHDIGKLEELAYEKGVVEYTVRGRLKGHLVIGSEMVDRAATGIPNFPEELLLQLQHLILSHHGRLEFGSPTVPMTVEAFVLNMIDDLDAKMNMIEQLRRKMKGEELSWTDYQRILERYLYLGGFEEKVTTSPDEPESGSNRQPTLF
jgi:3'-5' exoribonuclease